MAKVRFPGTAKLVIDSEVSVKRDAFGAQAGDGAADLLLTASDAVVRTMLSSAQNPVMACMSGKLKAKGNA